MKTFNEFASAIAKQEGKKSETSIGNVREILKVTIDILKTDKKARKWFFGQIRIDGKCEESAQPKKVETKVKKKAVKK